MYRTSLTAITILLLSQICSGAEPNMSDLFTLDGVRYIKARHEKEGVAVFSNNGVRGPGLTLSFFGKLNARVLDAYNLNVAKVVLFDGTKLPSEKVRTKSSTSNHKDGWGIDLGSDRQSVGVQVDLDISKIVNFQMISGTFMISVPSGSETIETAFLEDKKKSSDAKSGVSVEMCMNWGSGRYFLLKVPNAEKVQGVTVLDDKGNEFEQTSPFQGISRNQLKLYVKKPKDTSFRLRLDVSKDVKEVVVPFTIGPVVLAK